MVCVQGIIQYPDDNVVPSWVFDLILLFFLIFHILKFRTFSRWFLFPAIAFVFYALLNTFSSVTIVEKLYILRPWVYLSILAIISTRLKMQESLLGPFIAFLLIKYAFIFTFFGVGARPGFFQEINFDLLLLIMALYTETKIRDHFVAYKRNDFIPITSVGLIVLGSLSRSGLIAYALTYIRTKKKSFLLVLMGGFVLMFLFVSLAIRPEFNGISGIDRFIWAKYFLSLVSANYDILFFGNQPIRYLPSEICSEFSQFQDQYLGFRGNRCLSNIFTSHILRFPYEFGLIGFFIFYLLTYKIIKCRGLHSSQCILIIGLLAVNGLSVSGLSSAYAFVALFYLTLRANYFRSNVRAFE